MNELLKQLQQLVEVHREIAEAPADHAVDATALTMSSAQVNDIQSNLAKLRDSLEESGETTAQRIEALKQCSSNPGSQYYWIIFVALYGSIYFLQ